MSSLSLLGIAWDRYQALQVAHTRTRGRGAEPSAILMVIMIDLSSVCLMIPYCLNMEFSVHEGTEICREDWQGLTRIGFGVTTVALQFCVPFLVSLYVYVYIIHSLKDRTKEKLKKSVHLRRRKIIKAVSRLGIKTTRDANGKYFFLCPFLKQKKVEVELLSKGF